MGRVERQELLSPVNEIGTAMNSGDFFVGSDFTILFKELCGF